MKIIFDNDDQKQNFMRHRCCPNNIDSEAVEVGCEGNVDEGLCIHCWENCGIELEVKDENCV